MTLWDLDVSLWSLLPSSCVAGGSLSILNSSLVSSSVTSFPKHKRKTRWCPTIRRLIRIHRHFFYFNALGEQSWGDVNPPSLTSWMMSSGKEKLFSVFGNGKISDSCCKTHTHTQAYSGSCRKVAAYMHAQPSFSRPHQCLHVVHGS